jgi:methylmalonyl-CoA/ethylmalonyl-CoA epimerase
MQKIEHIGIAVKDFKEAIPLYTKILGTPPYKTESVESEKVDTAFFRCGPNKIELLQSTDPEGVIANYIQKKGAGIHHLAIAVSDIKKEMSRLKKEGFILLNDQPKKGADNKLVCFVHPKSTGGVLLELCQEIQSESL